MILRLNTQTGLSSMSKRLLVLAFFVSLLFSFKSEATSLQAPAGRIVVTISGAIENTNASGKAALDRAMLEEAGLAELVTSTPHTQGTHRWRGVRLSSLLEMVGASGRTLTVVALDGYRAFLSADVIENYDPLLALDQNGKPMRVRDKGPAWIIFPWDERPELDDVAYSSMSVWQVSDIIVE
jgi:hypothetical protein